MSVWGTIGALMANAKESKSISMRSHSQYLQFVKIGRVLSFVFCSVSGWVLSIETRLWSYYSSEIPRGISALPWIADLTAYV